MNMHIVMAPRETGRAKDRERSEYVYIRCRYVSCGLLRLSMFLLLLEFGIGPDLSVEIHVVAWSLRRCDFCVLCKAMRLAADILSVIFVTLVPCIAPSCMTFTTERCSCDVFERPMQYCLFNGDKHCLCIHSKVCTPCLRHLCDVSESAVLGL